MKQQGNFTQGPILAPLCRFALPVLLALLLQAAYGAADLLIVGQFSDAANISAVSTGSQIMHTFTTVAAGFAMGVTVLIGKKIGEGSPDEAGRVIGGGAALFVWMGIAATLLVPFFAGPLCRLMQAPEAAFAQTQSYVRICALGSLFILSYNVLGSVFRGVGDSKTPLFTVAAASLFNVAGDLLLVAGLKLGAAGAAIATVAAQGLSVFICLLVVRKKTLPFAFSKEYLRLDQKISGAIFRLGAPVALQSLLVNISFLAILAMEWGWRKSCAVSLCWRRTLICRRCPSLWLKISAQATFPAPTRLWPAASAFPCSPACFWPTPPFSMVRRWPLCSPATPLSSIKRRIICEPTRWIRCWSASYSASSAITTAGEKRFSSCVRVWPARFSSESLFPT